MTEPPGISRASVLPNVHVRVLARRHGHIHLEPFGDQEFARFFRSALPCGIRIEAEDYFSQSPQLLSLCGVSAVPHEATTD